MQINKNETKSFIHSIKNERGGEEGGGLYSHLWNEINYTNGA